MSNPLFGRLFIRIIPAACALLLVGVTAQAANTWTVGASGKNYTTIALALANGSTVDGDTISVDDATHTEQGITVNKSVTITGSSAANTTVQAHATRGSATDRIFLINAGKTVTIEKMTLRHGKRTTGVGGAIQNNGALTLRDCTLTANDCTGANASDHGGGALSAYDATATTAVLRCNFVSNMVTTSGVGGGGIYHIRGVMTIDDSTFESNGATNGAGGAVSTFTATSYGSPKNITIRNSTFSGNLAGTQGGGVNLAISAAAGGTSYVYNCTFVSNVAYKGATTTYGGGLYAGGNVVEVYSSLFATNRATSGLPFRNSATTLKMYFNTWEGLESYSPNPDVGNQKQVATAGVNLALANNGGATKTHALLAGSVAIDKGTNSVALTYDQRGTGYNRELNGRADCGAYEYLAGPIALAYSTNIFRESPANNGIVDTVLTVTLSGNDSFTGANGDFSASKYATANIPAGLFAYIQKTSATTLSVTLTNKATSHVAADSIVNLSLAFLDGAFTTGPASAVGSSSNGTLTVAFNDAADKSLSYSSTAFTEASANDGAIAATPAVVITSHNEIFSGSGSGENFVNSGKILVSNLPGGLTAVITRTSDATLLATLTGNATDHNSASNVVNLTFAFQNGAFSGNDAGAVLNSTNASLTITFADPVLTYNGGAFLESGANDGSITNAFTITLAGDTFTGSVNDDFADGSGEVTVSGQPSGLTWKVNRDSATQLTVSLTGNAMPHNIAQNSGALSLVFNTSAFTKSAASVVTNNSKSNYSVTFADPALTYSRSTVVEVEANNGTVAETITITLSGDTFTGANGNDFAGSKVTTANVPSGLTAKIERTGVTNLLVSFLGNASPHGTSANANNVTFTFLDTAFAGGIAAIVTNSTKSNLSVLFREEFYINQSIGSDANDGSANTAENAWRSLTNAVLRAPANSFINVMYSPHTESNILVSKTLIIRGQGAKNSIIQAAAARKTAGQRIFRAMTDGITLTFRDLTLQHGDHKAASGEYGGAIMLGDATSLVMERCTVRDNDTENSGGAIASYTTYDSATFLTINECTFSGNMSAVGSGAIGAGGRNVRLRNSTFSGNSATNVNAAGGAVGFQVAANRTVEIFNCTFVSNSVGTNGYAGAVSGGGAIIYSSVFAGNTANGGQVNASQGSCGAGCYFTNCVYEGTWNGSTSLGGNISTNFAGVDPVLADNGGQTMTHALLVGSAAIGTGVNPLNLTTDQRGTPYQRVVGTIDCGAVEFGAGGPRGTVFLLQ